MGPAAVNLLAQLEAALAERDIYVSMLVPGETTLVWLVRDRKPSPDDNSLGIHLPCGDPEIVVELGQDEDGLPLINYPQREAVRFDLAAAVEVIDGLLPPLPPKAGAS